MPGTTFWSSYAEAALTSLSFFCKALWAFILGYVISSCIQVFITRDRMQNMMGKASSNSMVLGTFFGFISSSCSFAALATTKSLFQKGAGFMPAIAFLLASTNLVIELGIVIGIFLGWQFVVGEYVGGILLILLTWLIYCVSRPKKIILEARRRLQKESDSHQGNSENGRSQLWHQKLWKTQAWRQVAQKYFMEWGMVWKDVTIGFTVAGIIAAFVPPRFFEILFIGTGQTETISFWAVLENAMVGPIAAFFTFIGSMGNIPLAAILYENGVSFGGIMAFIFSDLVVFPVIRVNAKYYGWKMALYIVGLFFGALVLTAVLLHYSFAGLGILPQTIAQPAVNNDRFAVDYTFFLNLFFLGITGVLFWLKHSQGEQMQSHHHNHGSQRSLLEQLLFMSAIAAYLWLLGGIGIAFFMNR